MEIQRLIGDLTWGKKQQEIIDKLENAGLGEKVVWKNIVSKESIKSLMRTLNARSERAFIERCDWEMGQDEPRLPARCLQLYYDNTTVWGEMERFNWEK